MTVDYVLKWLDDPSPGECRELAELHCRLLPGSPLAAFGQQFLGHCYYRMLPRMGLVHVLAGVVDKRVAGFIAVTPDADGFMRAAFRAAPFGLGARLAVALLSDPRRILALCEAAAISGSRRRAAVGGGELLSFAVDGAARSAQFVRATGIRIAADLIAGAVQRLEQRGVGRIRSLVDADNKAVRIMYGALGWKLASTSVAGWRTPQVEFVLDSRRQEPP